MPLELPAPNETTLAAMEDARTGKVEVVTIDEIRAVIRESNKADRMPGRCIWLVSALMQN